MEKRFALLSSMFSGRPWELCCVDSILYKPMLVYTSLADLPFRLVSGRHSAVHDASANALDAIGMPMLYRALVCQCFTWLWYANALHGLLDSVCTGITSASVHCIFNIAPFCHYTIAPFNHCIIAPFFLLHHSLIALLHYWSFKWPNFIICCATSDFSIAILRHCETVFWP